MCGRATLVTDVSEIAEVFEASPIDLGPPRFNVAPGQPVLVVRARSEETGPARELALLKWGLVPRWAKDAKIGHRFVQARAETVETTPAYRDAFRSRRCLFVVDGFFEWSTEGGGKKPVRRPHHVKRADAKPFAIAAVWDRWRSAEGDVLETCAVVTTAAGGLVANIHDRMPLVLGEDAQARWLASAEDAHALVADAPRIAMSGAETFEAIPVSTWVNDVKHDDARCIARETPTEEAVRGQIALKF